MDNSKAEFDLDDEWTFVARVPISKDTAKKLEDPDVFDKFKTLYTAMLWKAIKETLIDPEVLDG